MKKHSALSVVLVTALIQSNLSLANADTLKKLEEKAPVSTLIAKGYLQERTSDCKRYSSEDDKKKSSRDKVFKSMSCKLRDVEIKVSREECDGQETILLETTVFGKVGEFEGTDVLESEKKLLKFVLIKSCLQAIDNYKATHKKDPVTVLLDSHTKVTMLPRFATIIKKSGGFLSSSLFDQESTSTELKGITLLTVLSQAEFDTLINKHFKA